MDRRKKIHIAARSLAKRFGRVKVFSGIDLSVGTGDSLALTGPNGSGKSTLLEIACGLQPPTSGSVSCTVDDSTVPPSNIMSLTGMSSPRINPYNELTGTENIDFMLRSRMTRCDSAAQLVARFGLTGHIGRRVGEYSTGMKQRLKIILSVLTDPPVLMFDEPGSNLDEEGRESLFSYIEEVREHKLIIIATNDPAEAALCGGRVHLA